MKVSKVFFDMEFTELSKNADIISLACISEQGTFFIGEFSDYNPYVNPFVMENVIPQLFVSKIKAGENPTNGILSISPFDIGRGSGYCEERSPSLRYAYGTRDFIQEQLTQYLEDIKHNYLGKNGIIEFVTDVGQYDMILMTDLLSGGKTSFEVPEFISPAYHDINQDITRYVQNNFSRRFTDADSFNIGRAELLKYLEPSWGLWRYWNKNTHDAVWDASISKRIYKILAD